MFDTKRWWQSRTIWLGLIGILATLLRFFEIEIDAADQGALADHILAVVQAVSFAGSIITRARATAAIKARK